MGWSPDDGTHLTKNYIPYVIRLTDGHRYARYKEMIPKRIRPQLYAREILQFIVFWRY